MRDIAKNKWFQHRAMARKRGIEFKLSFFQWYDWWLSNGIDKAEPSAWRGYNTPAMGRKGDIGPYELGNIYLTTVGENLQYYHATKSKKYKTIKPYKVLMTPLGEFKHVYEATKAFGKSQRTICYRIAKFPLDYYWKIKTDI
jgi:hypothetical protein